MQGTLSQFQFSVKYFVLVYKRSQKIFASEGESYITTSTLYDGQWEKCEIINKRVLVSCELDCSACLQIVHTFYTFS